MKYLIYILFAVSLASCKSINILESNSKTKSDTLAFEMLTKNYEHILSPDDKLSLSIWNHDDLSIGSAFSIYNTNESFGKWVLIDPDSSATIPYAGDLKLAGLTLSKAEDLVAEELSAYIKNPIVELRVLNREVTVLGEVNAPGNYLLEKELNTLIEYIGKAQGLNFYADSKKIQVVRNEIAYLIDLRTLESFHQKNIYLQSGDIIYVPSKKGKKIDLKAPVLIPFASLLTSVGVLISVVSK